MANPAKAYLATQVETTTQGELLLMLYEAAIKFLKRAQVEIDNKDFAKKGIYISKAMAIIHELSESLNKEKGGDITPKLGQLYMFCTSQLIKANIRLDKKMIEDVIKILDGLRSAYAQIVPAYDGKAAPGDSKTLNTPTPPPGVHPIQPQAAAPTAQPKAPVAETPKAQEAKPAPAKHEPEQPEVQPEKAAKPASADKKPAKPTAVPGKLRNGSSAAKFRAANAYFNANR